MFKFAMLAAVVPLVLACATGSRRSNAPLMPDVLRTVTGLSALSSGDLPSRYRRLHDLPGAKYLIWSYEQMCVVDVRMWIRTRIGDNVSCEWRLPR